MNKVDFTGSQAKKKLRVLACFDKFKGSIEAKPVGQTVISSLQKLYPNQIEGNIIPLSDGGDGFIKTLTESLELQLVPVEVTGPLPSESPITAHYAISKKPNNQNLALIEMASASGLVLITDPLKRNPLNTTTKGVGDLILAAYNSGCKRIIVGHGGSATNDGGLGCLQGLGVKIFVKKNRDNETEDEAELNEIVCGKHLTSVSRLDNIPSEMFPNIKLEIVSDVTNPFFGDEGAVSVFSKQKGAVKQETRDLLEQGMINICDIYAKWSGVNISDLPGMGAAGGLSGGLYAGFKGATIKKGIEFVAEAVDLEDYIQNSDIVITGEGAYDEQSKKHGKVISKVEELAKKYNKKLVVICGKNETEESEENNVFELLSLFDVKEAMTKPKECLQELIRRKGSAIVKLV